MQIGIIGAGNVGRALTQASIRAGHSVTITAPTAEAVGQVAAELGATPADSNAEAVADAEVVILAVPFDAVSVITSELGSRLDGEVLILELLGRHRQR
jgi:predicted dinucleotide-binding enzyme